MKYVLIICLIYELLNSSLSIYYAEETELENNLIINIPKTQIDNTLNSGFIIFDNFILISFHFHLLIYVSFFIYDIVIAKRF